MIKSINREKRNPPWCGDCIFLDDMQEGRTYFVMDSAVYEIAGVGFFIPLDTFGSPIKRGTHDSAIKIEGDIVLWRSDKMNANLLNAAPINFDNYVKVVYKPLTLEEKVEILWSERGNW